MSFLDVIKRNAAGAARGLAKGAQSLLADEQPVMQQAVAPTAPADVPAQPQPGFALPELDPNDPDFEEKQKVHAAYEALEKHFAQANPEVNYQEHYNKMIAGMKEPQERQMNPFRKFAIAFGTQDPERPYAPNVGLAGIEATEAKRHGAEMSEFEKTLGMQKEAMTGQIRQHMAAGEFRKALAMAKAKADLDITSERAKGEREHKFKMAEIEAQVAGKKEVAKISAQAAMDRAERRIAAAKERGNDLKLSPSDKVDYSARVAAIQKAFDKATMTNPQTLEPASAEQIEDAEEDQRQALRQLHDFFEDREIGDRPPAAGPRKDATVKSERPSGAAWKAAAGQ